MSSVNLMSVTVNCVLAYSFLGFRIFIGITCGSLRRVLFFKFHKTIQLVETLEE